MLRKTSISLICFLMSCIMVLSLLLVYTNPASAADEYDTLRARWKTALTGSSTYSLTDPNIASRINEITTKAQTLWNTMIKTPNRATLWSELHFNGSSSATVTAAYTNLKAMALAYSTRGSSLQGNTTLRDDIIGGLDWMNTNVFYTGGVQYQKTSGMTISSASLATNTRTPSPTADVDTTSMLHSEIWKGGNITVSQTVTNGTYTVYLWVMEDYMNNFRSFDVKLEGAVKGTVATGTVGNWTKYGPYTATVSDGSLTMDLVKVTGDVLVQGMAIYTGSP